MHSIPFLLLLLTYSSVCIGCFHCCNCGALNLTDPYLFIGEYLNMACTLTQETVDAGDNSSRLYFTYGADIEVPKNETTILNSTTIVMNKLMTSIAEDGPYHCRIRDPVNVTREDVDSTWIELEYPPKEIENFNCIIYDWDESMVCTWDLGVTYHNIYNINTTLFIYYDGHYGSCPKLHLTNCTWNRGDGVSFDRDSMQFSVGVKNTKHKSETIKYSDWKKIKQTDNVKPSKVDFLIAKNNGSRCINLEWSHPRTARDKAFIITLSSEWNDNQIIKTKNFRETICELMPDTEYNIKIVTVPDFNKGYESDPEYNTTRTDMEIPGRPPEVSEGGFSVNSESCDRNQRSVTVYWKSVPREFQNGPMLGYYVSVSGSYGYNTAVSNPNQLYLSLTLPCEEEITVSIQAWGKAGNSDTVSIITIPKKSDISLPYHIVVEAQKNSTDTLVEVSWIVPNDNSVRSCVVFYCQYDTECTNEIQWRDVFGNYSSKVIDHIQFDKKYRFGVSCDGSGFKWQTCYYFRSMEPLPPSAVDVTAFPEESATVDWSSPSCENSPYIENYLVTWCVADRGSKRCEGGAYIETISSLEATHFIIKDLDIEKTYGIRVQNQARYRGVRSDYSKMKFVQPSTSGLRKDEIIGISFAGIFLFAMAVAGVIFIIRQAAPRIRKFNRNPEIQDIVFKPEVMKRPPVPSLSSSDTCTSSAGDHTSLDKLSNGHIKGKEFLTQISKDSGRGSITSELHSPGIESKHVDLNAVEEESSNVSHSKDSRKKNNSGDKNETPPLDPYYSRVTIEEIPEVKFRQHNFNQNITTAHVRASFPNVNQPRISQNSDKFSILSNGTSVYKSSSEEKMLLNLDEDDEDGYKEIGRRCKSLDTVRPESYQDDKMNSYVRHDTEDVCSVTTNGSSDFTANGLCPLMVQSNEDHSSMFKKNSDLKRDFDSLSDISVEEGDLKKIVPAVVSSPSKEKQDPKKQDFLRMNSLEKPNLHIPLTPYVDTKDDESSFSCVNNAYISEENIIGQGHCVVNSGKQDTSNSAYLSETSANSSGNNEPNLQGMAINGGYVTEDSLNNNNSTRQTAETSLGGVGSHLENRNESGYVAEQELLNNSSACSEGKGNSGGYVTESSLNNNNIRKLAAKVRLSENGYISENQNKSEYVDEKELLSVNATGNSESIGNSLERPSEIDNNNLLLPLSDHELVDSDCSVQVPGSEYVSFDVQKGAVPSSNTQF